MTNYTLIEQQFTNASNSYKFPEIAANDLLLKRSSWKITENSQRNSACLSAKGPSMPLKSNKRNLKVAVYFKGAFLRAKYKSRIIPMLAMHKNCCGCWSLLAFCHFN
jgi:hypothetical protein